MKKPATNCVVLDCDGTILPRDLIALLRIVDVYAMPEKASKDVQDLWNIYGEKALNGTISHLEERAWMVQQVSLYSMYRLRLADAYKALERVRLKRGVKTFLKEMNRLGIPVAIVSYGVKQFIWYALWKEGVAHLVSDIFATDIITWDQYPGADPIKGLNFDSMVTPSNKGCWSELFAKKFGIFPENILAVGDSLGDKKLGYSKENRLILIEKSSEIDKHGLYDHFGEVRVSKSFKPAHEWVKTKLKNGD